MNIPLLFAGASLLFLPFVMIGLVVLAIIFWIMMLIDVAKRPFAADQEKIAWVLVVALAGIVGALVYYFAVKRTSTRS